ncbi:CoA-binding protein [Candidatus Woesearchaeota archaeon]|nr:CoA-binding protein [Candidatus Woesearchaeota archaeon]
MSILVDESTVVVMQGITGKEGQRAVPLMKGYGVRIAAGVTPGKGGQDVDGIPVYDTVKEAMQRHPEINTSSIYVPPFAAKDAVMEVVANGIKTIHCLTEGITVHETAKMVQYAKLHGVRFIGPSSIGVISPGKSRLGVLGGFNETIDKIYQEGSIGVISKSGGMANETAWIVRQAGLGQSTVVGIGGDRIMGSTFTDLLELFEKDTQTKGVVLFGELGGTYEDQVADMVQEGRFTKPIAAFIAGRFAEQMPQGIQFGHAGALIEGTRGLPSHKIQILRQAGVLVAERHDQLGELIKEAI